MHRNQQKQRKTHFVSTLTTTGLSPMGKEVGGQNERWHLTVPQGTELKEVIFGRVRRQGSKLIFSKGTVAKVKFPNGEVRILIFMHHSINMQVMRPKTYYKKHHRDCRHCARRAQHEAKIAEDQMQVAA